MYVIVGKTKKGKQMPNILIGVVITAVLAGYIFGWRGVLAIFLVCLFAYCLPRKKSGRLLSWIEKIGK